MKTKTTATLPVKWMNGVRESVGIVVISAMPRRETPIAAAAPSWDRNSFSCKPRSGVPGGPMSKRKSKIELPIGRAAILAFQIEALRDVCCVAAEVLTSRKTLDEEELEDCARLDDALAAAHRILKVTVAEITLARLHRRNQARKTR